MSGSNESDPPPTSNAEREKYASSARAYQSANAARALSVTPYTAATASASAASGGVCGALRIRAPVRQETSSPGLANGR